jgi:hypothetical protein
MRCCPLYRTAPHIKLGSGLEISGDDFEQGGNFRTLVFFERECRKFSETREFSRRFAPFVSFA